MTNPLNEDLKKLYPEIDRNRGLGTTTAMALAHISAAILKRGCPVVLKDHIPGRRMEEHMARVVEDIIVKLDLKYMTFKKSERNITLTFGA